MVLRHRLQPHRLPDAAHGGVPYRVRVERLLAHRLVALVGGVKHPHHQFLAPLGVQIRGDVKPESRVSPLVAPDVDVVHIHVGLPVHCAEVQHHVPSFPSGGDAELTVIPQLFFLCQRLLHPRQLRLDAEWHRNLPVPAGGFRATLVFHGIVPLPVQAQPLAALHNGAGVFGMRHRLVHLVGPWGLQCLRRAAPRCHRRYQ